MKHILIAAFLAVAVLPACKDKDKDNPQPTPPAIDPNATLIGTWDTDKIESSFYDANGTPTGPPTNVQRFTSSNFTFSGPSGYKEEGGGPGVLRESGTYSRNTDQLTISPQGRVELLKTTYTIDSLTAKRLVMHVLTSAPNNGKYKYEVKADRRP